MTLPIPPTGSAYHQWAQFLYQTEDRFPTNYDGNEDFIIRSGKCLNRVVTIPNNVDVRIRNLVIFDPTTMRSNQAIPHKPARIYCDHLFLLGRALRLGDVSLHVRNLIQMSERQFRQAIDALSKGTEVHALPMESRQEHVHFPPGMQLSGELNATFMKGQTGLMIAAQGGHETVVRLLVTAKANLEAKNEKCWRALHFATVEGHLPIVDLLLEAKAQVDIEDLRGNSPLLLTAEYDYTNIAQHLLASQADPCHGNHSGETPLLIALHSGSTEVFRLLKEAGSDVNAGSFTSFNEMSGSLMDAAIEGDTTRLNALFNQGMNPNAKTKFGDTPLTVAAKYNQSKAVDCLIAANADIEASDKNEMTALKWGIRNDSKEITLSLLNARACIKKSHFDRALAPPLQGDQQSIVILLLERFPPEKRQSIEKLFEKAIQSDALFLAKELYRVGARFKTPQNGSSALVQAAIKCQEEMVGFLLSIHANLDGALLLAAKRGYSHTIARFIATGANVNSIEEGTRRTPLTYAILGDYAPLAQELINAPGAKTDLPDFQGMTPLLYSLAHGDEEIANLLLDKKANVRARDEEQRTPLIYAVRYDQKYTAQRILAILKGEAEQAGSSHCVGIDDKDIKGRTALIYAAIYGRLTMANMLFANGANITEKTIKHKTPLIYVVRHDRRDIAQCILDLLKEKAKQADSPQCVGIDDKDIKGKTALIYAAIYGRLAMANMLFENGANITEKTVEGKTALDCAAEEGRIALLERLLEEKYFQHDLIRALKHAKRVYKKLRQNQCLIEEENTLNLIRISQQELIIEILLKKTGLQENDPAAKEDDPAANVQQPPQHNAPDLNKRRVTWQSPLTRNYAPLEYKEEQKGYSDESDDGDVHG